MSRKNTLSKSLQLRFLEQLHHLLTNGYSLIDGLDVMTWDKQLKKTAHNMKKALKEGLSIDQAFERGQFHPTIVAHLNFVKESGDIVFHLQKCADVFAKRNEHSKKIQQISRYPLILLTIFILLLFMIKNSVLPSLISINTSQNSLPLKISFVFFDHIEIIMLSVCVIAILAYVIWHLIFKRLPIESQVNYYKHIPIYRNILRLQTSFQFATHLSAMLKTDLSLNDILNNMSQQKRLPIIRYYTLLMLQKLNDGKYVTDLLMQLDFFEKQFAVIFQENKDREKLCQDLNVYSELLIEQLERNVTKMISVIQPVFFIVLACFVILIYLSLMLPMYELIKVI